MTVNFCPHAIELSAADEMKELQCDRNTYCIAYPEQVIFPVGAIVPIVQNNKVLGVGKVKELRITYISDNVYMSYVTWEMQKVNENVIDGIRYMFSMNMARGNTLSTSSAGVPGLPDSTIADRIAGSKQSKGPARTRREDESNSLLGASWRSVNGNDDASQSRSDNPPQNANRWLDL